MPVLDLSPDELLTTTRSVRRRLDFSRPIGPEVIRECLEIALDGARMLLEMVRYLAPTNCVPVVQKSA